MSEQAPASGTGVAMSFDVPAAEPVSEARLRRLFRTIPFASVCPQFSYGIVGYFAALQIQNFDSVHKVETLAVLHASVAIASMVAQPLVGLMSDRTRTRWGARTPWILGGALVGCVGLVAAGVSRSVAMLLAAAVVAHVGFNALGGPLTAIQPDRVPVHRRGRYSALAGLGTISGAMLAPVVGSSFATRIPAGYLVGAIGIALTVTIFLILNPDRDNRAAPRPDFSIGGFLRSLWVNPVRHPDFAWVFLGRFLICGGYYMVLTFQLYILEDYIGLSVHDATHMAPVLSIASLPGFLLATSVSGVISDRIGRRKPIVLVGGLIIAGSALIPLASPTRVGLICSIVVLTIGFGTFLAVDQALVTEVLPGKNSAATDLGIINIAATLPNTIAPMTAAAIVSVTGGYGALYPIVAAVAGLGALAIVPVKAR
ncbi:MFS transporter [Nocardia sp. NEAU-G5]|uniref:MFS transporter n=1 Tax=Nocardia albiluteola TaxID=2842303 RepID=A0ABS6B4K0_9NOCA|nr:MFS transporter [Nocardia albiluteola]MBU3064285.1 MFS transporter [Nocardia albiluteola]